MLSLKIEDRYIEAASIRHGAMVADVQRLCTIEQLEEFIENEWERLLDDPATLTEYGQLALLDGVKVLDCKFRNWRFWKEGLLYAILDINFSDAVSQTVVQSFIRGLGVVADRNSAHYSGRSTAVSSIVYFSGEVWNNLYTYQKLAGALDGDGDFV